MHAAVKARDKELEGVEDLVPLTFLFERGMHAYCARKGTERVKDVFRRFLSGFLALAWDLWKAHVVGSRERERVGRATDIARVARGHLHGRARARRLRRRRRRRAKRAMVAAIDDVLDRSDACVAMQRAARGFLGRCAVRDVRRRHAAAMSLQNWHVPSQDTLTPFVPAMAGLH